MRKYRHNKDSSNYIGFPTQADHYSRRSKYSHTYYLFYLVVLAVEN